jgi:hypothetical protein
MQDKQELFDLIEENRQMISRPYAHDYDMIPIDELFNRQNDNFLILISNDGAIAGTVPIPTPAPAPYPYNPMNNMGYTQPPYPPGPMNYSGYGPMNPTRQPQNPYNRTTIR